MNDLIHLALLGENKDDPSPNSFDAIDTKPFAGRSFKYVKGDVYCKYELESQQIKCEVMDFQLVLGGRTVGHYQGENAYGATAAVDVDADYQVDLRTESRPTPEEVSQVTNYYAYVFTRKMSGQEAKVLARNMRLSVAGQITIDEETGQAAACSIYHHSATMESATEFNRKMCTVDVNVTQMTFYDSRSGEVLKTWLEPLPSPKLLMPKEEEVRWAVEPSEDELASLYPADALQKNINGRASIKCIINSSRHADNCKIITESPPGSGFGEATLGAAQKYVAFSEFVGKPATISITWNLGN